MEHPTSDSSSSLDEYRARYESMGRERFVEWLEAPVLVGTVGDVTQTEQDQRTFRTEHWKASDIKRAFQTIEAGGEESFAGRVIELRKRTGGLFPGQIGLGRTRNVDVVVPDPRVSKYHAYFVTDGSEHLIADAGSANGTFVDGDRLEPRVAVPLSDGSKVSFAGVTFVFYRPRGFADYLGA